MERVNQILKNQVFSEQLKKLSRLEQGRIYCGHGIGTQFHEDPQVLHYPNDLDVLLEPGMTFTIEPMINAGTWKCKVNRKDGWTVTTADHQPSAQYEHTILVTDYGCEILTLRSNENFERYVKNV